MNNGLVCILWHRRGNFLQRLGSGGAGAPPLHMFGGDIYQGFNNITVGQATAATDGLRMNPLLAQALLRELAPVAAFIEVNGVQVATPFTYAKLRTGGPEGPWCWNAITTLILIKLLPRWRQLNYGYPVSSTYTATHAVWADNVFLFGASEAMMQAMAADFTAALAEWGHVWKPSSLLSMRSALGPGAPWRLAGHAVQPVTTTAQLGESLSSTGHTKPAVQHRAVKADALGWAHKDAICNRALPVVDRFKQVQERVWASFLLGSGGWVWNKGTYTLIASFENRWLRLSLIHI